MSLLENFKVFNFNEGVPYVSVTNNGITFNKSVVMKMGYPEYVIFLIDELTRRIAIQTSDENTTNSVAFYKQKKSNVISVRWNGRDLLNTISDMMNWNLEEKAYRMDGKLLTEERAMIFDLNEAVELK